MKVELVSSGYWAFIEMDRNSLGTFIVLILRPAIKNPLVSKPIIVIRNRYFGDWSALKTDFSAHYFLFSNL